MLRDAYFLARADIGRLLRARETILWTFVMPVVFFYFLGTVTGGSGGAANSKDPLAVSTGADAGFLADRLIEQLGKRDYRVVRAGTPAQMDRYARRLEIPAGFTDAVLAGKPMKLHFMRTGEGMDTDMDTDYDRIRISRCVYTLLADLAVVSQEGATATAEGLAKLASEPRMLQMDVKPAGKRVEAPTGFEQSVPGTMVMFTLLVLFTSGAVTLTIERNQGILRRLASAPMSRGAVVLGKWGARMGIGVVQIAFAMVAGSVLFHVDWGPNVVMIVVILLAYGALAAALGMLLGNWGRTEGQVIGLGVIASNVLAAVGGCWWPIEVTPLWAQKLALALPTGWTMDALHKLMSFGAPPEAVILNLCVTVAAAIGAGYAVSRSFRFQ